MSIKDFFTTEFTIFRSQWSKDNNGNSFSEESEIETFNGHLQQADINLIKNLGLSFTKSFSIWCPINTDVKEGDTIYSSDTTYSVKAIQTNNIGMNRYLELIVEKEEEIIGS